MSTSTLRHIRLLAPVAAMALLLAACGGDDEPVAASPQDYESVEDQPSDAAASFVSPQDGDTVTAPFTVELAADGVTLAPVGAPVAGEGHLHVMADIGCYDTGERIPGPTPEDEAEGRFHLGDGSDSRDIDLAPGTYELCVQLGDGVHTAFGGTQTISVTVE